MKFSLLGIHANEIFVLHEGETVRPRVRRSTLALLIGSAIASASFAVWVFNATPSGSRRGPFSMGGLALMLVVALVVRIRRDVTLGIARAHEAAATELAERRAIETKLEHWVFHDALTGLSNRILFRQRIEQALTRSRRNGKSIAVLVLDLDDFKNVNGSLGHSAGDDLLIAVTARIRSCLRSSETAARLGGDEFGVLIEDADGPVAAARVAHRVMTALAEPSEIERKHVFSRASIGVAHNTSGDETADDLLRNAGLAMNAVKSAGKGRFELFRPELHAAVRAKLELEEDLRSAVALEEVGLRYQPIVDLRSGDVIGVEALARWTHETRGELSPATFIPLAEETGLIVPMGRTLLRKACVEGRSIMDRANGAPFFVTVNVSARQLADPQMINYVADALMISGLNPGALIIEITESLLMLDTEAAVSRLKKLKALGVRLAIDDFGTGYSSLSYLRRFPVDIIKVDQSFVRSLDEGPDGSAFMAAVLRLARTLGMETIVEGIERPGQLAQLRAMGCDMGQGFLFAASLEPGDVQRHFEADATWSGTA